jgi:hypothetical protein
MLALPERVFGVAVRRLGAMSFDGYPPYLFIMYDAERLEIGGIRCVALQGTGQADLPAMKKAVRLVMERERVPVVLCSPRLSAYQQARLSSEGIAFMTADGTMYLPFIGAAVMRPGAVPVPREGLSALAQCLFIGCLNGGYQDMPLTQIAGELGKGLSHISRRVKELEAIEPQIVAKAGREKVLRFCGLPKAGLLERFLPALSTPVAGRVYLRCDDGEAEGLASSLPLAGASALSRLTALGDASVVTYASERKRLFDQRLVLSDPRDHSEANVIVELWKYPPQLAAGTGASTGCVDPVSLYLSLQGQAPHGERVRKELDTLLERALGTLQHKSA